MGFPEDLTDSAIRLNGHWEEEEMDTWGAEMPMTVLDALQADLRAAQAEFLSKDHSHSKPEPADVPASEHTAAH